MSPERLPFKAKHATGVQTPWMTAAYFMRCNFATDRVNFSAKL